MDIRVSTGYQFDTYSRDVNRAGDRLFAAQQMISTGKKLNNLRDDPLGAARSITMRSLKHGVEQYNANLNMAKGALGYTESALGDTSTLINRAYQLAVQGANDATDQNARNAMAAEVTQLQARLVDLANSKGPSGKYLFAGQKDDSTPFNLVSNALNYNGDSNNRVMEIAPGQVMAVNVQGDPLFSDLYNQLESLKNNLTSGNAGAISGVDINNLQASLNDIGALRGNVGSKLSKVNDLVSQNARRIDELKTNISDIEDADLSQAIVDYQSAQTAYEAALKVASSGFNLSLMNFIQ